MEKMAEVFANLRSQPGMDEPLVRWGLLGILVICLWAFMLSPYLDWRDMRQSSIDMQAHKAMKTLALKAVSGAWKESSEQHRKVMETLTGALFQASSYASSQAALLNMMVALLQKHHLKLDSQRLLDVELEKNLGQRVGVFLRVQGSKADALTFIDAVSRSDKLVVLERLYVSSVQGSGVLLQFQATGFRLTGAQ